MELNTMKLHYAYLNSNLHGVLFKIKVQQSYPCIFNPAGHALGRAPQCNGVTIGDQLGLMARLTVGFEQIDLWREKKWVKLF